MDPWPLDLDAVADTLTRFVNANPMTRRRPLEPDDAFPRALARFICGRGAASAR